MAVETILGAAAALATATTLQAKALLMPANDAPSSLKAGDHVRIQSERRKVARAVTNGANDLASLRPMLKRMQTDTAIVETKTLLDKCELQLKNGNTEQAMLTLDGAATQIESIRRDATGNVNTLDLFLELERRESKLREKLGGPNVEPLQPQLPATQPATEDSEPKQPAKPPKRDELPVG